MVLVDHRQAAARSAWAEHFVRFAQALKEEEVALWGFTARHPSRKSGIRHGPELGLDGVVHYITCMYISMYVSKYGHIYIYVLYIHTYIYICT